MSANPRHAGWEHGPVRVLILAPDALSRAALASLLADEPSLHIVGQASDDEDLANLFAVYNPQVVLWELGWSDAENRLAALDAVTGIVPPILAIASASANAEVIWASGVRGLLGRNVEAAQIAAGLGAIAAGLAVFAIATAQGSSEALQAIPQVALPNPAFGATPAAIDSAPIENLTAREMEVLRYIADGMANKTIARTLEISEHTVKFHVNSILGKLNASSRTDAVVRASRAGLLLL